MAEREGLVELVRAHPAMLFDNGAACKRQHPAEASQRHLRKREKQKNQAGRSWGGGWREIRLRSGGRRRIRGHYRKLDGAFAQAKPFWRVPPPKNTDLAPRPPKDRAHSKN